MTLDEFNKLPEAAGLKECRILPSEVSMHPTLGLMIDAGAMWKLAVIAPDPERWW